MVPGGFWRVLGLTKHKRITPWPKDPKQRGGQGTTEVPSIWGSGGLYSGGLLSRATDFGSGVALSRMPHTLGVYTLGVYSLGLRMSDLEKYLPVRKETM